MASLRDGFATRKTFDLSYRKKQLRQLKLFYEEHEEDISKALMADLGKVNCVCVCVHVHTYVRVFVCVSMCMYVCTHICVCVFGTH